MKSLASTSSAHGDRLPARPCEGELDKDEEENRGAIVLLPVYFYCMFTAVTQTFCSYAVYLYGQVFCDSNDQVDYHLVYKETFESQKNLVPDKS